MKGETSTKLNYINAVRGIAILMVITLHVSSAIPALPDTFLYMCGKGSYGVQLFFVASAFTLFLSYTNRVKTEGVHVNRNFFIRRFFRISPMYYLAAIAYSINFYFLTDGQHLASWIWKVGINLIYFNSFVPGTINFIPPGGWSVGIEMVFYCCLPFLFGQIKNIRSATIWFVALTIFAFLLKLAIRYTLMNMSVDYVRPENWFLYYWFPNQVPVFLLGIILFFALKHYVIKNAVTVYSGITVSTILLLLFTYFKRDIDPLLLIPEHIIIAAFFAVNVFFMAQRPIALLDNKFTRFMGEISFSLYLVHFIIVEKLKEYLPLPANTFEAFIILLVLTLALSSVVSYFTYKLVELKGIKLGNRFVKRPVKPELNPAI